MSSIYYNQNFQVGMGRVAAFDFTDTKEKHSVINPEESGSGKVALWGDDNRYPQNFMKTVKLNGAAGSSYRFLRAAHYGQGFQLYREDSSDDGKRDRTLVPLKSQTDINAFNKGCNINRFWIELISDLETWNLGFPEYILSNDFSKIVSVRRMQTSKMRYERINPSTGLIENAYFSHNWQANTDVNDKKYVSRIPLVDSYCSAEQVKEYCKSKKIHKFTMPVFYPLIDETYYPEPEGHSVYRNGWMDVVNNIPEYKKAFSKNQLNIKYLVKISEEYFTRTYGDDWKKFTVDKKIELRKQLTNDIDEHLAGNKNAGKSIQVTVFKDKNNTWVDGISVEEIGNKNTGDGAGILDATAGNAEIMGAIGTDPNLMGVGIPSGKLNGGSGSDKREAFSILNSLFKSKRELTLDVWRMLRDYNEWDENLEGDFAVTELTTLDKNPTGSENRF